MGVIQKQAIKGTIWSYIGIVIGFLNIGLLSPKIFSTEQVGLTQVLIAISIILGQVATLGINSVTNRLFPFFRNKGKSHNGFLFLALTIGAIGFFVISLIAYFFKTSIIATKQDSSPLLVRYYLFVIPLILSTVSFSILDTYNKMLLNAVLGTFLKEFFLRIINLSLIIFFYLEWINFNLYVISYVFANLIPPVIIAVYLIRKGEFSLQPNLESLTPQLKREILYVALFGILAGLSGVALQNIDKYMVNQYIDLKAAGIYSITFFFGTLILIPQRAISKISSTIIAESWKNDDRHIIQNIYSKSSLNQFLIGMLIFIGIIANLHNIFQILPNDYARGEWVIILISVANMVAVLSGVSIQILSTSRYYHFQTWFMILLIFLVVSTNMFFIPRMGITGAALASLVSISLYTLFRCIFLYIKFRFQPLRWNHLSALAIGTLTYLVSLLIPELENILLDIFLRSGTIVIMYAALIIFFRTSKELNQLITNFLQKKNFIG